MNIATLYGRLAKENELNYTNSGTAYLRNTIAVTRKFKDQNGEYPTDFINFIAWGKRAELMSQMTQKGHRLVINGSIETGSYENKNGQTIYTTDINVNDFTLVETRAEAQGGNNNRPQNQGNPTFPDSPFESSGITDIDNSDLPF